ncbi:membrane protein insertase YidC [Microbulbifer sp. SA54]|uniref:membrane protein insertase YidC n=1 Tax=Microbulbifer sp. SA54 TaxID=3401577 RepID=UPI003AAAE765
MDWQRYTLVGGIAAVLLALVYQWNAFKEEHAPAIDQKTVVHHNQSQSDALPGSAPNTSNADQLPEGGSSSTQTNDGSGIPEVGSATQAQLISVQTDTLSMLIDPNGGDIVKVALRKYYEELNQPDRPLILLNQTRSHTYVSRSGLVGGNGRCTAGRPLFSSDATEYALQEGKDTLTVDLKQSQNGITFTKRFTFKRGDYLVNVAYLVDNGRDKPLLASMCGEIIRDSLEPPVDVGIGMSPFLGAALHTSEENYFKQDFEDITSKPTKETVEGGWVAMVQHYFLSAWIPAQDLTNTFTLAPAGNGLYSMGFTSPQLRIEPGQQGTVEASFYAGPKDVYRLEEISPYLDLTVDYGWLWWLAKPMFRVLNWIHEHIVDNWGWSIILLTVFIKALLYPLSAAGLRSMARMRKFAPQMKKLQEQYKDNRQKLAEETMKLYRREKINPVGGCLPILLQMPVFIGLYWMLMETVELRHAPWIGWIHDLSVKDPYFILPVVMGVTMWFMQKLNPQPTDPTQARIMQLMPVMMTFFFLWFPAGLVLYWIANNLISIAQTWFINKQVEAAGK